MENARNLRGNARIPLTSSAQPNRIIKNVYTELSVSGISGNKEYSEKEV